MSLARRIVQKSMCITSLAALIRNDSIYNAVARGSSWSIHIFYIIEHNPESSRPLVLVGSINSFLPCNEDLIAAGIRGFAGATSTRLSAGLFFSFFDSSVSLEDAKTLVIFNLILEGAAGNVGAAESNSTLPSIELFTATCVVSTAAALAIVLPSAF